MQIVIFSFFFFFSPAVLFKHCHCKPWGLNIILWCSVLGRGWLAKKNHPEVPDSFDWERNKNNQKEGTAAKGQHLFHFLRNHILWTHSLKFQGPYAWFLWSCILTLSDWSRERERERERERKREGLRENVPVLSVSHLLHWIITTMGIVNFQAQWCIFEHLRHLLHAENTTK